MFNTILFFLVYLKTLFSRKRWLILASFCFYVSLAFSRSCKRQKQTLYIRNIISLLSKVSLIAQVFLYFAL